MKHIATALVVTCLLVCKPNAQEHAPTKDVCRADLAVWNNVEAQTDYLNREVNHLTDGARNTNPIVKLSVREIIVRMHEMGDCYSVDEEKFIDYHSLLIFYDGVLSDRYRNFIDPSRPDG